MNANPVDIAYLITGVLFILGLKFLSSPASARFGNRLALAGMVIAVGATLYTIHAGWLVVAIGVAIGAVVGIVGALKVKMTAMPQMVALFNGAGGGAAAMVAAAEFLKLLGEPHINTTIFVRLPLDQSIAVVLTTIIGAVSFSGSIIAFLKLQELMTGRPITYPGQQVVNGLIVLVILAGAFAVVTGFGGAHQVASSYFVIMGAAVLLGVLFVLPIGGADMPVVISLLNACTGMAVAAAGFVGDGNNVLIISGALVGASGTLLTVMMGKAMNRSLSNVLFGAFGSASAIAPEAVGSAKSANIRAATIDDVATMLAYARQVVVVPGYGMAVAQAQHSVRKLADSLEEKGVTVKYAIHPVAGRMPGHMNVLLAEADVPYPALYDMEDINPEFPQTDVALIIGANDVTNPAARNDTSSPIYGMPILDVDKSEHIVVLKRSMRSGFAGIDNPLYEDPKCMMLFGDAKDSVDKLVSAVKTL